LEVLVQHFVFNLEGAWVLAGKRGGSVEVCFLMHFLEDLLGLEMDSSLELGWSDLEAIVLHNCWHFSCADVFLNFFCELWMVKLIICKHLLNILC
jgi:hypothetical protein